MEGLLCRRVAGGWGVLAALFLYGCGSSGGGRFGNLTGVVTDAEGSAVAGADVFVGNQSTRSLSNGTFTLTNVRDGYQTVFAEITINGRIWSGETVVDLVGREQNRSVNVVVSEEGSQGRIAGTVIDPEGAPLEGAKVFVGGPLTSTLAITDRNGNYRVDRLASGFRYTLTCSLAGYINDTKKDVLVQANSTTRVSFALARSSGKGPIPPPENVRTQAWTLADTITRADRPTQNLYEWLKRHYRRKFGMPDGPQAKQIERRTQSRATPLGSVIEIDLFWDYEAFDDLLGYMIKRGTRPDALTSTAVLRDPLASVFFDVDPELTPDVVYYYTVHRLDTIEFPDPSFGTVGPPSERVSAQPFEPIRAINPAQGASVSGDPIFQWSPVRGVDSYQIIVWDRFPDLQSDTDPDGVQPLWPADLDNPGSSLVDGSRTSQRYEGPALLPGRNYYWVVVAIDSTGRTFSVTPITRFRLR